MRTVHGAPRARCQINGGKRMRSTTPHAACLLSLDVKICESPDGERHGDAIDSDRLEYTIRQRTTADVRNYGYEAVDVKTERIVGICTQRGVLSIGRRCLRWTGNEGCATHGGVPYRHRRHCRRRLRYFDVTLE